ncbi:class I SAM-dependent methyltransferase [Brachybacterium epidermidis]|uniref:class I SAM-dependent methyltransferase n=1 Tax=Brachybacterium epidermidis TaxID=2781983 RepID=UPI00398E97CC
MLNLAGEVDALRVLDAGCGSGPLASALGDRGAIVSGFDLSPVMVDLARERLGHDADLRVADGAYPRFVDTGVVYAASASLSV